MSKETLNEWTVMVYLAGDNNLSAEMIYSIKEMYRVGTDGRFEVIVKFDPSAIGPAPQDYVISREKIEHFFKENIADIPKPVGSADKTSQLPADFTFNADGFLLRLGNTKNSEPPFGKKAAGKGKGQDQSSQIPGQRRQLFLENSADPRVLKEFIRDSIINHGAQRYMLVLSGHGSGAEGDFLPDTNPGDKGDAPAVTLSIPGLARVFRQALKEAKDQGGYFADSPKIDILGMDSCLMSMAEVGFEVRESVDYLVASEGFQLNTGWPYHRVLETLKETKETLEPKDLAKAIVEKYISFYEDYALAGASTDLAVCDLKQLGTLLPKALSGLANKLRPALGNRELKKAIVLAHWAAQSYKNDQYVDLWDFCDQLEKNCNELQKPKAGSSNIASQCRAVKKAIEQDPKKPHVVLKSCYAGSDFQHSHGISIYFPWAQSDFFPINPPKKYKSLSPPEYRNLEFAQASKGWVTFLAEYLDKTRRGRRDEDKHKGEPVLHFESPSEAVLFVRTTTSISSKASSDSELSSMKNPPDGFYRDKCS